MTSKGFNGLALEKGSFGQPGLSEHPCSSIFRAESEPPSDCRESQCARARPSVCRLVASRHFAPHTIVRESIFGAGEVA